MYAFGYLNIDQALLGGAGVKLTSRAESSLHQEALFDRALQRWSAAGLAKEGSVIQIRKGDRIFAEGRLRQMNKLPAHVLRRFAAEHYADCPVDAEHKGCTCARLVLVGD